MTHPEQETGELQSMTQKEEGVRSSGVNNASMKRPAVGGGSMAGVVLNKILKVPTGSRDVKKEKRKVVTVGGVHRPEDEAGLSAEGILSGAAVFMLFTWFRGCRSASQVPTKPLLLFSYMTEVVVRADEEEQPSPGNNPNRVTQASISCHCHDRKPTHICRQIIIHSKRSCGCK